MEKNTELLGVKVKSTTKEKIAELTEKAKTAGMIEYNGDIFDLFIEKFNQDELSKRLEYGADLKELNQITRRINDIFVNLTERNETNIQNIFSQNEVIVLELKEEINELKGKRKEFQEVLTEKSAKITELTDQAKVAQERIKELEEVQNGYVERIEEQKTIIEEKDEKIANKNELISVKEEAIAAMKEDIALNNELKKYIDSLQNEINSLQITINTLNEEIKKQKENLEFQCQKRVFAREQELNKEKDLEIKKVHDDLTRETKRYQERYEKVLDEKDKLRSANYELRASLDRSNTENERKDSVIEELKRTIQQLEAAAKKKE
jgi:chromosome segregation ATPase